MPQPAAGPGTACSTADPPASAANRPVLEIRRPRPEDVAALALLLAEMQRHYNDPVTDAMAERAARLACRPAPPADSFEPRSLIALDPDGRVCGSIVLNVTFPASRLSRSLYVRDLYVAAAARRRGVARGLLRAAARLTLAEGFSALDWTMDSANAPARIMYEGAGAQTVSRVYFRLAGDRLQAAAA
ncbi:GNAT family N-acetyltransferase [Roseomonas sp. AR75]|uniref:GNAT family N-acetyltransferase n=1 Tax=Roseomonas sp. AR75 TaxID=2562311 RepID=UPI001484ECE3|nr:GNAT family N-acetyltransferase [Roseomonas sp. AR75]